MANEQLGVATEPPPESLWGALPLCSGGLSIGGLYICAVGLDILKFEQTSLLYSASYFNLGGAWSFVSEGISPPKSPPLGDGTVWQIFSLLETILPSFEHNRLKWSCDK